MTMHLAGRRSALPFCAFISALALSACGDSADSGRMTSEGSGSWQGGAADTSSGGSWQGGSDTTSWSGSDTTSWSGADAAGPTPDAGNTAVSFGGAQDFGYVRGLIAQGVVPRPNDLDPAGFFAEHSTPLPDPTCGERLCVQAMLAVMGNLMNGNNCTMLQLGLNSPIIVNPADRPPLTLAVAIDVSGSMASGDKLDYVRDGLTRLVDSLHDDDRLALVTYASNARVAWPMQAMRGMRNDVQRIIDGLVADGGTNLHDGLSLAFDSVAGAWDSGRQNRVILLSDGVATSGITGDAAILEMSRARNSDGIGLTTIGLGTDFNFALMRGLAEQADGNFYFLENATAVDEVFTEELAYFTLPVAFDVTLEVTAGPHHEVVRAAGSNRFEVHGPERGSLEVPSVFFAHRMAHDDVFEGEDGVGRRGGGSMLVVELMPKAGTSPLAPGGSDVATVELTWREPGTNAEKTESLPIAYPFAPEHLETTGFFQNTIVTKSFVVLNIWFAIETAVINFHGGRPAEARDVLLRVIAAANDYEDSANDGEGDLDIRLDVELLESLLAVIVAESQPVEPPAPIPDDPWPAD